MSVAPLPSSWSNQAPPNNSTKLFSPPTSSLPSACPPTHHRHKHLLFSLRIGDSLGRMFSQAVADSGTVLGKHFPAMAPKPRLFPIHAVNNWMKYGEIQSVR